MKCFTFTFYYVVLLFWLLLLHPWSRRLIFVNGMGIIWYSQFSFTYWSLKTNMIIEKCHICTNCILIVAVVNVVLIHYKNRYWNDSTCQIAKFLFDVNLDKLDMLLLINRLYVELKSNFDTCLATWQKNLYCNMITCVSKLDLM